MSVVEGQVVNNVTLVHNIDHFREKSSFTSKTQHQLVGLTGRQILAHHWLTTKQENELCIDFGLIITKGPYKVIEREILFDEMLKFCETKSISSLKKPLAEKGVGGHNSPLSGLLCPAAERIGDRTLKSLIEKVKALVDEESKGLDEASVPLEKPKRKAATRRKWNHAETEFLMDLVDELGDEDVETKSYWVNISIRMKHFGRDAKQCRRKWFESIDPRRSEKGHFPPWLSADSLFMAKILLDTPIENGKIPWKQVQFNKWTTRHLKRKWIALKDKYRKNSDDDDHEIAQIIVDKLDSCSMKDLRTPTRAFALVNNADAIIRKRTGGRTIQDPDGSLHPLGAPQKQRMQRKVAIPYVATKKHIPFHVSSTHRSKPPVTTATF